MKDFFPWPLPDFHSETSSYLRPLTCNFQVVRNSGVMLLFDFGNLVYTRPCHHMKPTAHTKEAEFNGNPESFRNVQSTLQKEKDGGSPVQTMNVSGSLLSTCFFGLLLINTIALRTDLLPSCTACNLDLSMTFLVKNSHRKCAPVPEPGLNWGH